MPFSALLAALGAVLEISGFMLVAVELVRTQRRELGTAGPFQFLVTFTRWTKQAYRKLTGTTIAHEGAVELSGTLSVTGVPQLAWKSRPTTQRNVYVS
jgi:hypothetical protein